MNLSIRNRTHAFTATAVTGILLGLSVTLCSGVFAAPAPDFKIGVYRFSKELRTEERFRDMKEAGIDITIANYHNDPKSLEILQRLGLTVIVDNWLPGDGGGNTNSIGKLEKLIPITRFENVARKIKRHPIEEMFLCCDENSALDFPYLGRVFRRIKEVNPEVDVYFNLHSSTQRRPKLYFGVDNYQQYIEEYCKHISLDYICYDLYMYGKPENWAVARLYESFRIVSDACRRTNRRLWFVAQVNTPTVKVDITEQKLRYQAFSSMAFGSERLIWACWTPGWWTNNVLTATGEKTAQYERVKTVNHEIHRIAPHYMEFVRKETHFTGFTGIAAKWIEPDPHGNICVPQVNFNKPDGIDTEAFKEVRADDGLPLVVGEMHARDGGPRRALFVFAADDPHDKGARMRTVRFRTDSADVTATGPNGPVSISRAADGTCSFDVRSSMCVLLCVGDGK